MGERAMTSPLSFRWEGTDNPNDPSGVALFTVGSQSVSILFNDFSQAARLCGLIEEACKQSEQQAIDQAASGISALLKEYLHDNP